MRVAMVEMTARELRRDAPTLLARVHFDSSRIRAAMADQCVRVALSNPSIDAVERGLGFDVAAVACAETALGMHGSLFFWLAQSLDRRQREAERDAAALAALRLFGQTLRALEQNEAELWRRAVMSAVVAWTWLGAATETVDGELSHLAHRLTDAVIELP